MTVQFARGPDSGRPEKTNLKPGPRPADQTGFAEVMAAVFDPAPRPDWTPLAPFLREAARGAVDHRDIAAVMAGLSARTFDEAVALILVAEIEVGASTAATLAAGSDWDAVNIVGTGGGIPSFNISSTAAILAAACGVRVLKSGSASYSSASGAMDFLRAAGIAPVRSADEAAARLDRDGIAFYSPGTFSPLLMRLAMAVAPRPIKHYAPLLNRIGPMLRLLPTRGQLTGIANPGEMLRYVALFRRLGRDGVTLVGNEAGLDEACSFAPNGIAQVSGGLIRIGSLDPAALGLAPAAPAEIRGGGPAENVKLARRILAGEVTGAAADCVALNAALLICTRSGSTSDLPQALAETRRVLASGEGARLMARLSGTAP